jgi:hypothetical protein
MVLDSLGLVCACALLVSSISAWSLSAPLPMRARLYLRFAAMLFAALAVSFPLGLSAAVSLFLLPLVAAVLMVAGLARLGTPLPVAAASLALILGLGFGLAALLSGMVVLALLPGAAAGLVVIAASLNRGDAIAALAGASLLMAALASWDENARGGVFLFCAASLVGLARPARSENQPLRSSSSALRG